MKNCFLPYALTAAFLLQLGSTIAQTPQPTYTLFDHETGTRNYVARESVTLKPGFVYNAVGTETFTAKLDQMLVFPPTDATFAVQNADGTMSITQDATQGSVVGAISGQFDVSPSGAATYTIPIEVPAGINGMQPNISLVYSSQAGNGIAGWGWNIGGLSCITRSPKSVFYNNEIDGVDYLYTDQFLLNGNPLIARIAPTSSTSDNCIFNSMVADYSVIKTHETLMETLTPPISRYPYYRGKGPYNSGPKWFEVQTKDGLSLEFGNGSSSILVPKGVGNNAVLSWFVNKCIDSNGNSITYTYDNSNNEIVIKQIDYTGNGSTKPFASIIFEYLTRSELKYSTIGGRRVNFTKELIKIKVSTSGVTIRDYDLKYITQNKVNFLSSISVINQEGQKTEPLLFEWGKISSGLTHNTFSISGSNSEKNVNDKMWFSVNLNNDGLDDLIATYTYHAPDTYYYKIIQKFIAKRLPDGSVSFNEITPIRNTSIVNFNFKGMVTLTGGYKTINLNGDETPDLIVPLLDCNNTNCKIVFYDFTNNKYYAKNLKSSSESIPAISMEDFNNDGISDILYVEKVKKDGVYPGKLLFGNSKYPDTNFSEVDISFSLFEAPKEMISSDFNSDGLLDLMFISDNGNRMYMNNGGKTNASGILQPTFTYIPSEFTEQLFNSKFTTLKIGDFNGDGNVDFVGNERATSKWSFFISNGDFTFKSYSLVNLTSRDELYTSYNDSRDDCIIMDVDNDGKSDVIIVDAIYARDTNIWGDEWGNFNCYKIFVYRSSGNQLVLQSTSVSNDESFSFKNSNVTGDFNGDGTLDLITFGSNILSSSTKDNAFHFYSHENKAFDASLLTTIKTGLNNSSVIQYLPLNNVSSNNPGFYSNSSYSTYPLGSITNGMPCVANVQAISNNTIVSYNTFSYKNALIHKRGKGFLGFEEITSINSILNTKNVTTTTWSNTTYFPLNIKNEKFIYGNRTTTEVQDFSSKLNNSQYTNVLTSKSVIDHLADNSTISTIFDYGSDSNGNLQSQKTTWGTEVSEKIEYKNYTAVGSSIINKPQTVVVTKTQGSTTAIRSKGYQYQNGHLIKQTQDVGDVNQIITEYPEYDNFGNAKLIKVTSKGKTRSTQLSYTPSGRFVSSKTNVELGKTMSFTYDEVKGVMTGQTDEIGSTAYEYDGFGRLTRTTTPDKVITASALQWAGSGGPSGAKTYSYTETSGQSPVTVWYDALGREIRRDSYGLNNKLTKVSTEYNAKGQLWRVSEPYFDSPSSYATVTTYDDYGRPGTVTTPEGVNTYNYSNLTTKVTSPSGTTETTVNAAGQTTTSKVNGKAVDYIYYPSGLVNTATPEGGRAITMAYDLQGNRTKMIDPDAGITESEYNGFGDLMWETRPGKDGTITTSYAYLDNGLLDYKIVKDEKTQYFYNDDRKRLTSVDIAGKNKQTFTYDGFNRVTQVVETIGSDKSLTTQTEYDAFGRVSKEIYPSGYYILNGYDKYGYLTSVKDQNGKSIWEAKDANARGQLTRMMQGGRELTCNYDAKARPQSIVSGSIINMGYVFDGQGNLESRTDNLNKQSEKFLYDIQNRLTNWDVYNNGTLTKNFAVAYDNNLGTIATKSDLCDASGKPFEMKYGEDSGPHALTSIVGNPTLISDVIQEIKYNHFQKIASITEGSNSLVLTYGLDEQRRKGVYNINGTTTTRYFLGNYEEEVDSTGKIRKLHYINGGNGLAAIYEQVGTTNTLYYTYCDYQSNLLAVTNEAGTVVEHLAYDPWGNRRETANWALPDKRTSHLFVRGYTLHEHLDAFGLINMNGRVYDPAVAAFLSPDPFVQAPGVWGNYNRYGYCYNNPLIYTDPDGEWIWIPLMILGAYIGGVSTNNGELNPSNWDYRDGSTWCGMITGGALGVAGGNLSAFVLNVGITSPFASVGVTATGAVGALGKGTDWNWNFNWSTAAGGGGDVNLSKKNNSAEQLVSVKDIDGAHSEGVSLAFAAMGGWSFSVGKVYDGKGNSEWFYTHGPTIGYGGGLSYFRNTIDPVPGQEFSNDMYPGPASNYNAGYAVIGGSFGGNLKSNNRPTDGFHNFGVNYTEGGLSASYGPKFGIWWSKTKTKFIWRHEKK